MKENNDCGRDKKKQQPETESLTSRAGDIFYEVDLFGLLNYLLIISKTDWSFDWNWSEKQCAERINVDQIVIELFKS